MELSGISHTAEHLVTALQVTVCHPSLLSWPLKKGINLNADIMMIKCIFLLVTGLCI